MITKKSREGNQQVQLLSYLFSLLSTVCLFEEKSDYKQKSSWLTELEGEEVATVQRAQEDTNMFLTQQLQREGLALNMN